MSSNKFFHLLVVDDDSLIHQSLKLILPPHWQMFSVQKKEDIHWNRFYHAAFVDMHLQTSSKNPTGLSVVQKIHEVHPLAEIVAISGDITQELMESALKFGAHRFIAKPLLADEVLSQLEKIQAFWEIRNFNSERELRHLQWVGESDFSQKLKRQLANLKSENSTILIQGETGTGKEVVAKLLNAQENFRPFVAVNMAAIPENLFESEMFGHVKGAFTGAEQNKIGLLEAAQGGDLFLDEIEALPLSQQAKLLRFLETGEVRKVGAKESVRISTRIIAASNQSLEQLVHKNLFREDLYYRLSSQRIQLSPLRDRVEDIIPLAQYFLDQERPRRNKSLTPDALTTLKNYTWPGNVRELRRICEQVALTSPLPLIRGEDIQVLLNQRSSGLITEPNWDLGLSSIIESFEKKIIEQALVKFSKDIDKTSETLKVSRSNLYKKIKDYDIKVENL